MLGSSYPRGPRGSRPRPQAVRLLCCLWALIAVLAVVLSDRVAFAAGEDTAVHESVQRVLADDFPGSPARAKKKLHELLSTCLKRGCTGPVKAEVYVALGMVAAQEGKNEDAKTVFKNALAADPGAKLPSAATPHIRALWDQTKGVEPAAEPAAPAPAPAAAAPAPAAAAPAGEEEEPQPVGPAATIGLIRDALKADQEGRFDECIEKDKQALKIDDSPRTRLHLASCEARAGKLVDALKDAQKSLEVGIQKRDASVMKVARARVKELLERIPHVTFAPPSGVTDLKVTFDERPVPTGALTKRFSVDPGKHKVVAEGTVNGFASTYEEEYDIKEKESVTVRITLKPPANNYITQGQIQCMLAAKSQEDVQNCLPQNKQSLVARIGADLSGYSDTNAVAVYTPAFNASVASPTAGWNLGGNFLVDAVSAASPDIIASASPPFHEYRYAGGITGGYKPGLYGAQATASMSQSPDYTSLTGGLRLSADLNDKLITPTIGYSYSSDRIGRGPNNYLTDVKASTSPELKGFLHTHEIEAGLTLVLSPVSVLVVGGTASIERGDGSQPYRYVAMFDPASAPSDKGTVDIINRARLPYKVIEQLPTERDRFAIGGRYNRRMFSTATLRIDQRIYFDTWGMKASSTDSRFMVDLTRALRVWPHFRFHWQTGTNFYQRTYTATVTRTPEESGQISLPLYRTGDRELSPLFTATLGGGTRLALGNPEGAVKFGITFVADVMYTRYLDSLYVASRTAAYGSVGFDVEF